MIEPYLDCLLMHPVIAQLAIYVVCVLTCLAGIGCIMPSMVLFTTLGTLIGLNKLPFLSTILCSISGALTGSLFSFWLGRYYQASLRQTWLLRAYPQLLSQSEAFFKRFGEISIFIGRFLGPIRAILPLIAGMTGMRTQYFLIADISSAILWPLAYIIPSIYLVHSLPDIIAALPIYQLIYALIGLVIAYFMLKRLRPYYEYPTLQVQKWVSSKLITPLLENKSFPSTLLYTPIKKKIAYPLASLLIISTILLGLLVFAVLSNDIVSQWNMQIYHYVSYYRSAFIEKACIMVTLFNAAVIYFFWFTVLVNLVLQKDYWRAVHWAGLGLLSTVITEVLKISMGIPRPLGVHQLFGGSAFPSGHVSLNTTLLGGFLALLNLKVGLKKRISFFAHSLYGMGITCLAFSRLYLYAHWFTDIMGGVLVSIISLLLFHLSYHRKTVPLKQRSQLTRTGLISLLVGWILHFVMRYQTLLMHYASL